MIKNPLADIRDEVANLPELASHRTDWRAAAAVFWARLGRTSRLVVEEPEILLFAILQWLLIAAGYVAWFQILHLVPHTPAAAMPHPSGGTGFGIVILMLAAASAWSLFVLALVALPVGLLSAAMGAAHLLRRTGQELTIGRCLSIASRQVRPLWTYHAIDGYVTVHAVLARLPKRHGNRSGFERIAQETLYFAWKLSCAGVLPAMICGHGLIDSGRRSLGFVKAKLGELAVLRGGYGALCWAIGAVAYLLGLYVLFEFPHAIPQWMVASGGINMMIVMTGLPLISALAIILVLLQPIYILTVCDLYADHLEETGETLSLSNQGASREPSAAFNAMTYLAVAILAALVAHHIGLAEWMTGFDRGAA